MAHHFAEIDGKPHRIDDGAVNLGIAVDVEKKDGTRTLMVPVIRDAGPHDVPRVPRGLRRAHQQGAREQAERRRPHRRERLASRTRAASARSPRVPRLMVGQGTIVATGSIDYPVGLGAIGAHDRRREGHDDDLDLRPPHHPGRGVGSLPRARRGAPAGRARLLRPALRRARRRPSARRRAAARARRGRRHRARRRRARRPAQVDEELLQAVQAATSLLKAHRTHGHLAARLDPLGAEPEGDPALDPEPLGLTREVMGAHPVAHPAHARPGRDAGRRAAAPARDLLRARSPTRSSTSPRTASAAGCARRSSPASSARPLTTDEQKWAARPAHQGRRASSASCTRPTSARSSSRSRAWT